MQGLLGVSVDGQFGPNTRAALVRFQSRRQLLPDGICGPASWSALLGDDG
jgi:peptidoglycan hydrolase-like protein with peptidoglycan-binding domain